MPKNRAFEMWTEHIPYIHKYIRWATVSSKNWEYNYRFFFVGKYVRIFYDIKL